MARLFTTGFELGEAIQQNASAYLPNVVSTYARTGSYSFFGNVAGLAGKYIAHTITSQPSELYIRCAVMFRTGGSGGVNPAGSYDAFMALIANGVVHLSVAIEPDTNRLVLLRGATSGSLGHAGGTLLDKGDAVLRLNAWYVIELHAVIANSGGEVAVKVNNTTDMSYNGDTAASSDEYVEVVRFGLSTPVSVTAPTWHSTYLDDIAVNDTTGTAQKSWIGTGGVYLLVPNADGDDSDWTPSAGSDHYALVDEVPDDANTTYISAQTIGNRDLFGLTDLPATVTQVDLVQVVYQAALQDAGLNQIKDVISFGGTVYDGYTANVTSEAPDYIYYGGTPYYSVPGGTAAWGTADVAALQAGVEVV